MLQATETKTSNGLKGYIFTLYIFYYLACINWQKSFSNVHLWGGECVFKLLPETTAWQGEKTEHSKEHPEGKQGEDIQEGIHAQEKAKDHQLEKSHSNTSKSNSSYQTEKKTFHFNSY